MSKLHLPSFLQKHLSSARRAAPYLAILLVGVLSTLLVLDLQHPRQVSLLQPSMGTVDHGLAEQVRELLDAGADRREVWVYAITDVQIRGTDQIISVAGFPRDQQDPWTLEDATWLATVNIPLGSAAQPGLVRPGVVNEMPDAPAVLPDGIGGINIMPFKTGTQAMYGMLGVHDCGFSLPGWKAIDLFPEENMVYASQGGEISYVCRDPNQVALRIGYNLYDHLLDQGQQVGDVVTQGQALAPMATGTFNTACGYASQQPDAYHVHFCFVPNQAGAWAADGWAVSIYDSIFRQGEQTVEPTGYLMANWANAGIVPGGPVSPPTSGANFWDSLTGGVMDIIYTIIPPLADHESMGLAERVLGVAATTLEVIYVILLTNFDMTVPMWTLGIWFTIEAVRIAVAAVRWVAKLLDVIPIIG